MKIKETKTLVTKRDTEIGARVKLMRKTKKMTQKQLADEINLTFQQIQKYEKGINRIAASRLEQIAKILDTRLSWFFE